ncbi:MAG: M48 family metallopeptidase [Candidatus Omnitrophica bacterium]|nr:M48 family metallopeptidase [Candidatus Omnitrophota bacterium]
MNAENASEKSRRYSAVKTRFFIADLGLSFLSLVIFQFLLARPVSEFASASSANFYITCLIFSCAFLFFMYIIDLPLRFLSSFIVEKRFLLSNQSPGEWFLDEGKSAVLSFVVSLGCIIVFYAILRNFPDAWWVISAAGWVFFTIVLTRLMPVLLIPLFFKYKTIDDGVLKDSIMDLAKNAGVDLVDVCQIDYSRKTKKANAALVGLGKTRKVIFTDTLIDDFSLREVVSVAAHEFGHFRKKHIWQLLTFSAIVTLLGFFILSRTAEAITSVMGASGLTDLYILPFLVLLLSIFGIILMPAQNFFSRVLERQADGFTLKLTGDADAFVSVMKKLAEMNLADTDPSWLKKVFLYNHPPISERIRMAQEFNRDKV